MTEKKPGDTKGLVIFIGLGLLVIVISLVAYNATGDMGIEERFTHTLGLETGSTEADNNGWSGIAIEGSTWLYAVLLGGLVVACYLVFRHFRI